MAAENAQSTLSADGTEQTIKEITTVGTFALYINTDNMQNGDVIELRAKVKISSSGSYVTLFNASYAHDQGDPDKSEVLKVSVPVTHIHGLKYTLQQVAGTNRDYPYEIVQLDAPTE